MRRIGSSNGTAKSRIGRITAVAVAAALMCILSPVTVPLTIVPLSLATLLAELCAIVLGYKAGTLGCMIYLALGSAGLPVFSSYSGGIAVLLGPTGGYLAGYILLTFFTGLFYERFNGRLTYTLLGMAIGNILLYAVGSARLACVQNISFGAALAVGVLPFIAGDVIKAAAAVYFGKKIRDGLTAAGLI